MNQPHETSAPPASPPGFELRDEIGHGGMGVVYRARDAALDRDVAVKLLAERYPADSPAAQRFLSEARITGQLQHPGIPAVHQVGSLADGRPFLAMKLIKGSTLDAILKQRTDPAAERGRLLAVFEAVCQAVSYAHAHRVIHRDLKPANVMVGAFGEVQVMDWGLAKVLGEEAPASADTQAAEQTRAWTQISPTPEAGGHTQAGSLVGTPAFIPPEQALGEIAKISERADVFGLGALLAVILTGKPPYVGESFESVRVQAARGKLDDCFARLDACGAEPELIALCKQCLAFEPADRPADAGAVAQAVAAFRAAADERARRAELERVQAEGEALARAAEQRQRRRMLLTASGIIALVLLAGLSVSLWQMFRAIAAERQANQANVDLAAKNQELAQQQAEVEARFATAQQAIATFHTGVSEDFLLKNREFTALRTKLLKQAAGFYADLEKLLAGKTDAKSRQLLAAGYFQLGELTAQIGDQKEALAVQRKALALRRELAAAPGADVEARLELARSLRAVANLLRTTGDMAGALSAFQEQRDLAAALEAEAPTDAVRMQLAYGHNGIGVVLSQTGKPANALQEYQKALAIRQQLADANPAVTAFQSDLAASHLNIGIVLSQTGKPAEALQEFQEVRAIRQQLADANPTVTAFQSDLAYSHLGIGTMLSQTGKLAEALQEYRKALAIRQELAKANPAVTAFQSDVAQSHFGIGVVWSETGNPAEALQEYQKALAIRQKLADAHPTNTLYINQLGDIYADRGWAHVRAGDPAEAAGDLRRALALWGKEKATDGETLFERGRALALLAGLAADGKSGVIAAEAAAFADQAVAALRDAFQAGWSQYDELKEPDFDPLRKRADFQKLLVELETRTKAANKEAESK
jgi:tetratricopeptide (TPR) repeat protein